MDSNPSTGQHAGGLSKFDWLRAILADKRIPGGEKAVLAYAAVFDVLNGRDTFCIRQSTLAMHCGTSKRTVNAAVVRAKKLGYLKVSRERERGAGRNGADELRLTAPLLQYLSEDTSPPHDLSEDTSPQSDQSEVKILHELSEADARSDVKQTRELSEAADALSSTNGAPNSSLIGSSNGSSGEASPRPPAQARPSPPTPKNQPPPRNQPPPKTKEDPGGLSPLARRLIQEARAHLDPPLDGR
jgi:hypothetical protein